VLVLVLVLVLVRVSTLRLASTAPRLTARG
jgi:hypothetical protein